MSPTSTPAALEAATPAEAGLDGTLLARLGEVVRQHIADGICSGATLAVARRGRLILDETFGPRMPPDGQGRPLWLLYSNTKVITAVVLWQLAQEGRISFGDPIARHVPEFERHGKGGITLMQLLTHQGGFPSATVSEADWADHARLRRTVCDFVPEWPAGSRVQYHPSAAHWTAAVLIEAVTGQDYRTVISDRVIAPLGLADEMAVGLGPEQTRRAVTMLEPDAAGQLVERPLESSPAFRAAGVPGGGGYATARAMATFYQMLVGGGALGSTRLLGPRTLAYATRNFTGERIDEVMGVAMHRGLGPHSRGHTDEARGLGSLASPTTFGHGGVGSSYCWGDPVSGVSFAFLSDTRQTEEVHVARMEVLSNLVHASIVEE